MKEKTDSITRDLEMMRKKNSELQDVNNILTKQHEDDQVLLEDVKATNMMLREALETKELEWGTSDSQLASFAPKESLLGEIEQHFNRFQASLLQLLALRSLTRYSQTFGSPQRGSSKMPNFMDVVKRDFENLAMRIHRLRQKMEKKWPEPPPGTKKITVPSCYLLCCVYPEHHFTAQVVHSLVSEARHMLALQRVKILLLLLLLLQRRQSPDGMIMGSDEVMGHCIVPNKNWVGSCLARPVPLPGSHAGVRRAAAVHGAWFRRGWGAPGHTALQHPPWWGGIAFLCPHSCRIHFIYRTLQCHVCWVLVSYIHAMHASGIKRAMPYWP